MHKRALLEGLSTKAGRISRIPVLVLMSILPAIPARVACAQQRPGIHPFVKTPEACSYSGPIETENLYSLIRTEIQAVSLARAGARASFRALAAGREAAIKEMSKTMTDLRQERIGLTCAGFVLSPFTSSKNETAATAAKYLVFAYEELGKMTDEMLGITLRESLSTHDPAAIRLQLSDLERRRHETLQNMTDALNLSLSLLLAQDNADPGGEREDGLILTHAQKMSLEDYLHSQFPSLSERKSVDQSDDFIKQATVIESFLASAHNSGMVTTTPK